MASEYAGQVVALPTRHGKERAIRPAFHDKLDALIEVVDVDTDAFGTFAGDVPRIESPLKTAIAKAQAGLATSTRRLSMASEGTIGPDPAIPLVTSDIEVLVFVDGVRDVTISQHYRSTDIVAVRAEVRPGDDIDELLARADFPRHGLIVKPPAGIQGPIVKGLGDAAQLVRAIERVSSPGGSAVVESDFRAHRSPSRMANIAECARRLVDRIATSCPECEGPGWGPTAPALGLPCSSCDSEVPTAVRAQRHGCPGCGAVREVPSGETTADPRWCHRCNP